MKAQSFAVLFALALSIFGVGCKTDPINPVDEIQVSLTQNLEEVRVALVFGSHVKVQMGGIFPVSNYGFAFVNPHTDQAPFEVGFNLSTQVVNDQDYFKMTPTLYLPNGYPHDVPYPLVQVNVDPQAESSFNTAAYVDVTHGRWLGVVSTLKFDSEYFPDNFLFHKTIKTDENGNPTVIAHVFGRIKSADGKETYPAGMAILADIKSIKKQ